MSFNIAFDYRFDTFGFFNDPARRAALEEAARLWEDILKDEFEDIPAGVTFDIRNPADGVTQETITLTSAIDDLLVFVGARNLPGNTLGRAGPSEATNATDFEASIGTVVFDTGANWNFNLSGPVAGRSDFISVAMHEIGHIFGFSTSQAFSAFNQNGFFVGPNTLNANNGQGVPLTADEHVQDGFRNDMVLMDPTSLRGIRVLPSDIDKAMLADIGWEIDGFIKQGTTSITGTASDDALFGSLKGEEINGGAGNDQLAGDAGNDILRGGAGQDVLFGQQGRDIFVLAPGEGQNQVADFDLATEVIRVVNSGFGTVTEALAAISKPFSNVSRLTLSDGSYMDVFHVSQSGTPLTAANIELGNGSSLNNPTEGNDLISLIGGNETINALGGIDTVVAGIATNSSTLQINADNTVTIIDRNGSGGTDTVANAEILQFSDRTIDLSAFSSLTQLTSARFKELAEMYVAYFNRAPDAEGLFYWADKFAEGRTLEEIAERFFDQVETRALYPNPSDTTAFINAVYNNVLGRDPDADGFAFWKDKLDTGAFTQGAFVLRIINGAKNGGGQNDVDYLSNKADLGLVYAAIRGLSDSADGRQVMNTFGDQATSNMAGARSAIETHYGDATANGAGEFVFNVVGIVDDPFVGVV